MTENEAIKKIKYMPVKLFDEEADKAKRMAIQALEEIQQYRAIGTVEELQSKLEAYRELGTMEELKTLKEKNTPKKVAYQGEQEKCPTCGSFHVFGKHCTECGQAVDYD